ncbi:hypothetical protein [Pseudomonas aeruginosa]|uniref:hypothetical protein n=1 Tax=Pseudomonas aeruginosa TaxID=287 RepID=UPI003D07D363
MKFLTFKDTCGRRIDSPAMEKIINFVAAKVGADPTFILTRSQLDQAMAHLKSITPESEHAALATTLRELNEQALSAYMAGLNPFAAKAVAGLVEDTMAGQQPQPSQLKHIAKLTSHSNWTQFQASKTLPDTCGQELTPVQAPVVRVVSEALSIPESNIRTQSQLSYAMGLIRHTCKDPESAAALESRLKEARLLGLEMAQPALKGLGLEALNALKALAQSDEKHDVERVQRLVMGIRRDLLQGLKRQYPDLEKQIAESGDEQAMKNLAYLQHNLESHKD